MLKRAEAELQHIALLPLRILLSFLQFLFQLVPLFLCLLFGLLGIIYFSMPILTPHPDPATTPDSATQAATESMANLLFMLRAARLLW